jgi:hypothetical protein
VQGSRCAAAGAGSHRKTEWIAEPVLPDLGAVRVRIAVVEGVVGPALPGRGIETQDLAAQCSCPASGKLISSAGWRVPGQRTWIVAVLDAPRSPVATETSRLPSRPSARPHGEPGQTADRDCDQRTREMRASGTNGCKCVA